MSEIRRKKAVTGVIKQGKSLSKAMRDAGYSKAYATNPQNFRKTKKFQAEVKPILEEMEKERDAALKAMKGKRGGARYSDLNVAVVTLTKAMRLLEERPTEINEIRDLSEIIRKLADSSDEPK